MNIDQEMVQLGDLRFMGTALLQFTRSLFPGEFTKKSRTWVYSPNFVAFEIRFQRVQKLNVLVRPVTIPAEFSRVLPLFSGPLTYGRAEITSPRQLAAACAYIEASWRDWYRGVFGKEPEVIAPAFQLASTKSPAVAVVAA